MKKLDAEELSFTPAYEISFLAEKDQRMVYKDVVLIDTMTTVIVNGERR